MQVLKYLTSLLPTFGRDQVLEDCRITRAEIADQTLPAYDVAADLFKSWKFKSKELQPKIATFGRMVKGGHAHGIVAGIQSALKQGLENLTAVEDRVRATYNSDVAGQGLTYAKAQLLQYVELAAFASKYARRFLVYIYVAETAQYTESGTTLTGSLTPAELDWIEQNFVSFCTACSTLLVPQARLTKLLADIPDVVVTQDNVSTLGSTMGGHRLDPLQFGLIPVVMNPIYHVRMAVAEWQANRYKSAQEEVKLLALRKLNLERLKAGKPDARLQREIEYMEGRIQNLNFKIAEMESKYA